MALLTRLRRWLLLARIFQLEIRSTLTEALSYYLLTRSRRLDERAIRLEARLRDL